MEFLPPDAIEFLVRLATEHPDPDRELWRAEKEGETAYFGGDILTCGINTVRGRVAEELRNLLITEPALPRRISPDDRTSRPRSKHLGARVRGFDLVRRCDAR